jgi:cytoskeletal protein CcmA (bactofilin family)
MGFFGIEFEKKPLEQGALNTILGDKAKFKGELVSSGSVSVSGEFEGKINVHGEVIVAAGSKVVGEVRGSVVVVSGEIDGNIWASESLEISKNGRVHGDLTGGKIIIEDGSSYRGKVRVESEESAAVEKEEPPVFQPEPYRMS